jgi:hypothetical protein
MRAVQVKVSDGPWSVDQVLVGAAADGTWRAVADLRNRSKESAMGSLTLEVARDGRTAATLNGTAEETAPGARLRVTLTSTDPFRDGSYDYALSTGIGF